MTATAGLANTPDPPYYAVIFTSRLVEGVHADYGEMADRMVALAQQQPGFLGFETSRDASGLGMTVSYWRDTNSIRNWHSVAEHKIAQTMGREKWYAAFVTRICKVERDYSFVRDSQAT